MEPPEPSRRPSRFRIPIIITGTLVFFVAVGHWARGRRLDPRIAGRWQFTVTNNGWEDRRRLIDFQSDGRVRSTFVDGRSGPNVANGRWWVEDNQLVILNSSPIWSRRVWLDLQIYVIRLLRRREPWDVDRYNIIEVTPSELRLRFRPHPGQKGEDADWALTRPAVAEPLHPDPGTPDPPTKKRG